MEVDEPLPVGQARSIGDEIGVDIAISDDVGQDEPLHLQLLALSDCHKIVTFVQRCVSTDI